MLTKVQKENLCRQITEQIMNAEKFDYHVEFGKNIRYRAGELVPDVIGNGTATIMININGGAQNKTERALEQDAYYRTSAPITFENGVTFDGMDMKAVQSGGVDSVAVILYDTFTHTYLTKAAVELLEIKGDFIDDETMVYVNPVAAARLYHWARTYDVGREPDGKHPGAR